MSRKKSLCLSDFSLAGIANVELISIKHCVFCKAEFDLVVVVFVLCVCFFGLDFGELLCKKWA